MYNYMLANFILIPCVAVPCKSQRLFCCIFWLHHCVWSAVSLNFHYNRWSSYVLCRLVSYSCIYKACMSPAINKSSAIRHFKHSDAIKIHDGIIFYSYMGLSHVSNNCELEEVLCKCNRDNMVRHPLLIDRPPNSLLKAEQKLGSWLWLFFCYPLVLRFQIAEHCVQFVSHFQLTENRQPTR